MTTKQSLLVILLSQSVLLTACLDVEMAMQIDPNSNAEPATQQVVKEAVPEIKQIVETQIYANDEIASIDISDFNPAGLLVHLESSDLIYNASSSTDYSYEYNEQGHVSREYRVRDSQTGTKIYDYYYHYDENGRLIKTVYDKGADGEDIIYRFEYDDNGRLITEYTDIDANDEDDSIKHYRYDAMGQQIAADEDINADGQTDYSMRTEYNQQGRMIAVENLDVTTGQYSYKKECNYDADGLTASCSFDAGNDGEIERYTIKEYDQQGQLVRVSDYSDLSQLANRVVSYEYDSYGNNTLEAVDYNGDGKVDESFTYAYSYWD